MPPKTDAGVIDAAKADAADAAKPVETFSIGGSVSGLLGTGLVLQDNGGDDLPIAADGTFTFSKKLAKGAAFAVTIKTQPTAPSQTCTLSADTGTVGTGNVTTIAVNCDSNKFAVGGTVSGLVGTGLTLQNNGGGDLIVNANGTFAFAAPIASGGAYAVTVKTQPGTPSQMCVVTAGSGTIAAAKITNVAVVCTTSKFTVGGTVAGLAGTGLTLQVNGVDSLAVTASGTFTFATPIASGVAYAVTVSAQPTNKAQTCVVSGGTGTVGAANVTSVAVNCTTNKYTIGGTVSGLSGTAVLQNNLGNDLNVSANGTFAFSAPIDSGAAYAVTVKSSPTAPTSQTCTITAGTGTVVSANVTSVVLTCVTNKFKVGVKVTGLAGTGLVFHNGADDLAVGADGTFQFATAIASNTTYSVTVKTQPSALSQTCTVTGANGTVGAADVQLNVACVTSSFTVGGAVAGLTGLSGLVLNNGAEDLPVAKGATAFTFATKVISGGSYAITVKTQPTNPSQSCSVATGSGTVTNGNVVTAMVNCTTNTYAVGGTASNVLGTGLVLQNNGADDLTVTTGGFTFAIPIASNGAYAVSVKTQPTNPSQTCTVTAGSGTVTTGAITTVSVACVTDTFNVGGTTAGVVGSVVLQDNAGDDLTVNGNTTFTFATKIASGAAYAVTVKTPPVGYVCTITNGTGTVAAAAITNVGVTCTDDPCLSLGGTLVTVSANLRVCTSKVTWGSWNPAMIPAPWKVCTLAQFASYATPDMTQTYGLGAMNDDWLWIDNASCDGGGYHREVAWSVFPMNDANCYNGDNCCNSDPSLYHPTICQP